MVIANWMLGNPMKRKFFFFVVSFVYLLFFSTYTTPLTDYLGYDTAIFMLVGKGLLHGLIPYTDLFDHKGPILYFIQALGQLICPGKPGIFLLQLISLTFSIELIYKNSRFFLDEVTSLLPVLFFLILFCATIGEGNMTEEWSLPFIVSTMYLGLKYFFRKDKLNPNISKWDSLIIGLSFGVLFLIRLNNATVNTGIYAGILIAFLINRQFKNMFISIIYVLLGILLIICPVAVFYYAHDSFGEMVYGTFTFNFMYASSSSKSLSTQVFLMNFARLLPLLVLIVSIVFFDKKYQLKLSYIVIPASLITFLAFISGRPYYHYFTIVIPLTTLLFVLFLKEYRAKYKKIALFALFLILPYGWTAAKNAGNNFRFSVLHEEDAYYNESRKVLQAIPLNERNSVWFYGDYTLFLDMRSLVWNDFTPKNRFFYLQNELIEIDPDIKAVILDEIKQPPVKWIIAEKDALKHIAGLNEFVTKNYECIFEPGSTAKFRLHLYRLTKRNVDLAK